MITAISFTARLSLCMLQILFSLCKAVRICTQAMRRIKTLFFYIQCLLYYKLPGCVEPGNNTLIFSPALKGACLPLGGRMGSIGAYFLCMKGPCSRTREKVIFLGREKKKMCHPWRNWVAFFLEIGSHISFCGNLKVCLISLGIFCVWFQLSGHEKTGSELRLARLNNDPFCHQRGLGDEIAF